MGYECVGIFMCGGGFQKKDFVDLGVGCIYYGQIYIYYGIYVYEIKSFVLEEFVKKVCMVKLGDLVIVIMSENDEDVCKVVVWFGDEDIVVSSDVCFYLYQLNFKFVVIFFKWSSFKNRNGFILLV